jgi:hypothetical protein
MLHVLVLYPGINRGDQAVWTTLTVTAVGGQVITAEATSTKDTVTVTTEMMA